MATIKDVAKAAGVSTATVSAVINDSAYVSPDLRSRVLARDRAISAMRPRWPRGASSAAAASSSRSRSPISPTRSIARIVCAAEAAVAAWGYSLVVFNSDEKPENEKRILARIRMLGCDGVGARSGRRLRRSIAHRELPRAMPTVLLGRSVEDERHRHGHHRQPLGRPAGDRTICSISATRRIGSITGPLQLSTGRGRLDGMLEAMAARGLAPQPGHVRSGEFREDAAYSVARDLLAPARSPDRALCRERR